MNDLLETIKRTVEATVEGPVTHRESVAVVETFRGQTVWEGMVEVFDVAAPPPAGSEESALDGDNAAFRSGGTWRSPGRANRIDACVDLQE